MAEPGTIEEIVDIAIGHDERVANAARQLTSTAIIRINHVLQYGTPQQQQQVLRAFIPALIKQAEKSEQNEEIARLRKDLDELRASKDAYETPAEDEDPIITEIPTDASS